MAFSPTKYERVIFSHALITNQISPDDELLRIVCHLRDLGNVFGYEQGMCTYLRYGVECKGSMDPGTGYC